MGKKKVKVELEFSKLEEIARYYEFPSAVFFLPKMPAGTRKDNARKKIRKELLKMKEIIEELLEWV